MGQIIKKDNEIVYRQDDGEITAWLTDFEEKTELSHEGSPLFGKIFYVCVIAGVLYLTYVFLFF